MSGSTATVPARLRGAHPLLLADAETRCGGDWDRVELVDGSLLIHNRPRRARPAPVVVETPATPPAPTVRRRTRTRPAPADVESGWRTASDFQLHRALSAARSRYGAHDERTRTLVAELARRDVERLAQLELAGERPPAPAVVRPAPAQARVEPETPRYDRPLPEGFDIRAAWEQLDVSAVASSILERCRAGLPEPLPLDLHPDVLALEGINLEIVSASVRNPQHVEIAGRDTKEKGYPVLRFTRGDVMTVVGLRDLRVPMVIATYASSRLDPDEHRAGSMKGSAGGGGTRKESTGLPTTPKAVVRRLRAMGADVLLDELSDAPTTVSFRGQELGKIAVRATRTQCQSDYQRIVRRMEAIRRRE